MAVQMHVANSASIRGAGVFAAGPYWCSKGDVTTAVTTCMSTGVGVDIEGIKTQISNYERSSYIDNSSNLKDSKVFLFSGSADKIVNRKVVMETENFYKEYSADVKTQFNLYVAHTMPTKDYGSNCASSEKPFIGRCNYEGAFYTLSHLFDGKIKSGSAKYNKANVFEVTQDTVGTNMGPKAYVYAPKACQESGANCPLHVVFHGCQQTIADIDMQYVEKTGYNEVAENNNLVILYPQAVASAVNPMGCWDWWGYTTSSFANKNGPQIKAVNKLISGLKSGELALERVGEDTVGRAQDTIKAASE